MTPNPRQVARKLEAAAPSKSEQMIERFLKCRTFLTENLCNTDDHSPCEWAGYLLEKGKTHVCQPNYELVKEGERNAVLTFYGLANDHTWQSPPQDFIEMYVYYYLLQAEHDDTPGYDPQKALEKVVERIVARWTNRSRDMAGMRYSAGALLASVGFMKGAFVLMSVPALFGGLLLPGLCVLTAFASLNLGEAELKATREDTRERGNAREVGIFAMAQVIASALAGAGEDQPVPPASSAPAPVCRPQHALAPLPPTPPPPTPPPFPTPPTPPPQPKEY